MQLITITVFLLAVSIFDIKTKKIPFELCLIFSIFLLIQRVFLDNSYSLILALLPGLLLFAISIISDNGIGKGDCLTILTLGLGMSIFEILNLVLFSLFFTAIFGISCFLKNRNRKQKIVFTPFLFLAFILNILGG